MCFNSIIHKLENQDNQNQTDFLTSRNALSDMSCRYSCSTNTRLPLYSSETSLGQTSYCQLQNIYYQHSDKTEMMKITGQSVNYWQLILTIGSWKYFTYLTWTTKSQLPNLRDFIMLHTILCKRSSLINKRRPFRLMCNVSFRQVRIGNYKMQQNVMRCLTPKDVDVDVCSMKMVYSEKST